MGFRFRKRVKLFPGLHMTVTPRGLSTSIGITGARATLGSTGRISRTFGLPGTGLYHIEQIGSIKRRDKARREPLSNHGSEDVVIPIRDGQAIVPGLPGTPTILSRRFEKDLHAAIQTNKSGEMANVFTEHPETFLASGFFLAYFLLHDRKNDQAREIFTRVWERENEIPTDPLFLEYVNPHVIEVNVGAAAKIMTRIDRDCVGLIYAELLQEIGKLDQAIGIVRTLEPTEGSTLSLADLYLQSKRWREIIDLSDGITNENDATALLLIYRGVAFREQAFNDAARECFKQALASRKRHPDIRHLAMIERARSYLDEGKRTQARRDVEKVMASDPKYPGVESLLNQLS